MGVGPLTQAQHADLPYVPQAAAPAGVEADSSPAPTGPVIPNFPATAPAWSPNRTTTNAPGSVQNTHRWAGSEDGSQYRREHTVTNPRGPMTQSWERSRNEEGYQYRRQQTFTAPDGTPLRQHERSYSGTDPNNYTRQNRVELRDGRTILHQQTRSWDGTTGTRQQTFNGPNGQTRYSEHTWRAPPAAPGTVAPERAAPPVEPPKKRNPWGWLEKLNPFRKGGLLGPSKPPAEPPARARGFTIGSGHRDPPGHVPQGVSNRQPGRPSPNSQRPPWAGGPHASTANPGKSASPAASGPVPSRGKNR